MKSHWNIRYLMARSRRELFQRMSPEAPWMAAEAVRTLDQLVKPTDVGLEFGSGRSTHWLSSRVNHLVSIEENPVWAEIVKNEIRLLDNVELRLMEGATYYDAIDGFPDSSLDFCLVDGAVRDQCALRVIPKLRSGAFLVIDDVNRYLPGTLLVSLPVRVPSPATPVWSEFVTATQGWRSFWASDGVTATAFYFRP